MVLCCHEEIELDFILKTFTIEHNALLHIRNCPVSLLNYLFIYFVCLLVCLFVCKPNKPNKFASKHFDFRKTSKFQERLKNLRNFVSHLVRREKALQMEQQLKVKNRIWARSAIKAL